MPKSESMGSRKRYEMLSAKREYLRWTLRVVRKTENARMKERADRLEEWGPIQKTFIRYEKLGTNQRRESWKLWKWDGVIKV